MRKKAVTSTRRNPVARFAAKFQRATSFRDRTRYRRHDKHKSKESCPVPVDPSRHRTGFPYFSHTDPTLYTLGRNSSIGSDSVVIR